MSWAMGDMITSIETSIEEPVPATSTPIVVPTGKFSGVTPQELGWATKTEYDYQTYLKSSKELADSQTTAAAAGNISDAVGGVLQGDWASNAAIYTWNDDYGDVGPKFPELERQLFGSEYHVKTGIAFDKIAKVDVTQEGNIRIKPVVSFKEAGLHPVMMDNVRLAGYDAPTPIQQYTLPAIFEGHDIVACAQTGSGKTAAFLIPILSKLMGKAKKLCASRPNPATFQAGITRPVRAEPLVLIVAPSRELATQIFDEARRFCYRTMFRPCVVYGGGPLSEQVAQLSKGCDVLIGTPGRLVDFIGRPHYLTLSRLRYMVIDEADEMVGSDWETELKQIMSGGDQEEGNIIYLMFSATFPKMAREMAAQHLRHDHVRIRIGRAGSSHANIKQDIIFCEGQAKRQALFDLLMSAPPARTMIFVNSKRTADEVDDFLFNSDIPCTSIHSDRTQREREDSIRAFRTGKAPVLITTGVAARGLDIHNVMHVINYDLPSFQYGGIEEYTHRIGRTGRIGNVGLATSFYNSRDADLAPILVKTLLETRQLIPDFLNEFIPEGFTADGEGDISKLNFENEEDAAAVEGYGGEINTGWGDDSSTPAVVPSGRPASADEAFVSPLVQPTIPQNPVGSWGITAAAASVNIVPAVAVAQPIDSQKPIGSWVAAVPAASKNTVLIPAAPPTTAPQKATGSWITSTPIAPVNPVPAATASSSVTPQQPSWGGGWSGSGSADW